MFVHCVLPDVDAHLRVVLVLMRHLHSEWTQHSEMAQHTCCKDRERFTVNNRSISGPVGFHVDMICGGPILLKTRSCLFHAHAMMSTLYRTQRNRPRSVLSTVDSHSSRTPQSVTWSGRSSPCTYPYQLYDSFTSSDALSSCLQQSMSRLKRGLS